MTKVNDATQDEFDTMHTDMINRLGPFITEFADAHGLSGLSSTCLAVRVLTDGLVQLGGPSAITWITTGAEANRSLSMKEMDRLERRSRMAMERMASHFDAKLEMARMRTMQ